jgi:hypothetical protein
MILTKDIVIKISEFSPELLYFYPLIKLKYFKTCPIHEKSIFVNYGTQKRCPICGYTKTYTKKELHSIQKRFMDRNSKVVKKRKYIDIT